MKKRWVIGLCAVMAVSIVVGLVVFIGQGSAVQSESQSPIIKYIDRETNSIVEISPVLAERNGGEVLIQDFGKWDLEMLGYAALSVPCQDKSGAVSIEYVLPEDAAQGTDKWYILNLDMEIDLGQDSQEGACEIKVYANNAPYQNFYIFSKVEDGSIRFYNGDAEMSSTGAAITHSAYIPGNRLMINGVQPGKNALTVLMVKYGGIEVKSLRILNSSAVECTDIPEPGFAARAASLDYLPKLTPDEEVNARDIVMNDASVRDLIAGREFSIDLVYEWDMPQVSGKVARVDISLDRVYEISYDWPWPPLPIRKDTHPGTFWVREMTVIVSLQEGTVLGIMPERHPLFIDPGNLPEELRPEGYTPIPEVNIPELTADEETLAKEMALNDPVVQQLLAGKTYEVAPDGRIGVWHTSGDLKKIGAALEIAFDKAYWFSYDQLPNRGPVQDSPEYSAYMEYLRSSGGLWADSISVMVSFEEGKVVDVMPMQVSQYGGEK